MALLHFVVCGLVVNVCLGTEATTEWSYMGDTGPSHWKDLGDYDTCGDEHQSPVDISNTAVDADLAVITLTGYDDTSVDLSMSNNGHSVTVNVAGDVNLTIAGGKLPGTYKLAQFHWHWGSQNTRGSEHTLEGMAYPMEMHLVHYKATYPSINEAMDQPEGLAVLGFFFEVVEDDVAALNFITDKVPDIPFKGDAVDLVSTAIGSILPDASDLKDFFRYSGSLTTPGCFESVVWTVYNKRLQISQAQLNNFRAVYFNDAVEGAQKNDSMVNNYRPVQSINDRTIYSSFTTDGATGLTHCGLTLTLTTMLTVFLWLFK